VQDDDRLATWVAAGFPVDLLTVTYVEQSSGIGFDGRKEFGHDALSSR
jgi:hypothetical protein